VIFIGAVLVSVFAQQTISSYFQLNRFDIYTGLVFKRPVYVVEADGKKRLALRRVGKPIPTHKILNFGLIIVALMLSASFSIIFVSDFRKHVLTTIIYLVFVFVLDLINWIFVDDIGSDVVYGDIVPDKLFRYLNRQLVFTIDSGIFVIFTIVIIGKFGGFGTEPIVKAFFTGVVSFYLISTCILIGYLLHEWNAILKNGRVVH
jgi:hypothetical protein